MSDLLTLNRFFVKYRGRLALGLIFVLFANYFGLLPAQITRKAIDFISTGTHHNYGQNFNTLRIGHFWRGFPAWRIAISDASDHHSHVAPY